MNFVSSFKDFSRINEYGGYRTYKTKATIESVAVEVNDSLYLIDDVEVHGNFYAEHLENSQIVDLHGVYRVKDGNPILELMKLGVVDFTDSDLIDEIGYEGLDKITDQAEISKLTQELNRRWSELGTINAIYKEFDSKVDDYLYDSDDYIEDEYFIDDDY